MSHKLEHFYYSLASAEANTGESLASIALWGDTLVVFLRHGGCTFCREALEDIQRARTAIENSGTRIVLVHMMDDEDSEALFARFDLADLPRVSDPGRELYRAFRLEQGKLRQLLGWKVWWRGFVAGILNRHGAGRLRGDGRQMPGVFLLRGGEIAREFRHRSAADRPDYAMVAGCSLPMNTAGNGMPGDLRRTS